MSSVRKKVDSRVRTLIENGVKTHQRTFMVLVGDKARDQVVNLHYILSKTLIKARPSVLWCYKKELGFSSNRKKRMRHMKKMLARGLLDPDRDDPFELFVSSTDIRYCYYHETDRILGSTYGMCILQDFEAVTPNLLARTVETVEGGGLIILLLKSLKSLKQLYTMTMDVHDRFRTESSKEVVGRFNERFILSLGSCVNCLVVDDELNVLPISSHARRIRPVKASTVLEKTPAQHELEDLKASLADSEIVGALVAAAKTLDQAKALLVFIEAISEKSLRSTVALTAARGRGKSASMGLAIACAVAMGYSNIFVTSPSPENLKTLFDFVFRGFDALDFQEHVDYELVQSTNADWGDAIVRVNVFHSHRQTIQYIEPHDASKLGQAELLVVDEAAAIPLPWVRALLGPYLIFLGSTVNGYEGTGRSLSLKLLKQLRHQSSAPVGASASSATVGGRVLRELTLSEPIRYADGDPVESWLNNLLCLEATAAPKSKSRCPHPSQCQLYYVDKDALFSYHRASEQFLQRLWALFVSSHYKNSPNDLILLSDAPSHHVFVLLGPVDPTSKDLPEILCVVQVALEGNISKSMVQKQLLSATRASGDLIPWVLSQQFQDYGFASLSGVRIVRIATHPDFQGMGYGSRTLQLLREYYENPVTADLSESSEGGAEPDGHGDDSADDDAAGGGLRNEVLRPRRLRRPLLMSLDERPPEPVHYLGTSFGVTPPLYRYWSRAGYRPMYMRLTPNTVTGEHTCIMLCPLTLADEDRRLADGWAASFVTDFRRRFLSLLGYEFRAFDARLSLDVMGWSQGGVVTPLAAGGAAAAKGTAERSTATAAPILTVDQLHATFSTFDCKRLEAYTKRQVDYHVVVDLLPALARLYFEGRIRIQLSYHQAAILQAIGLQHKSVDDTAGELGQPASQVLALFMKTMRKVSKVFRSLEEAHEARTLPTQQAMEALLPDGEALPMTMDEDLAAAGEEAEAELAEREADRVEGGALMLGSEYVVAADEDAWNEALRHHKGAVPSSVSVRATRKKKAAKAQQEKASVEALKRQRDAHAEDDNEGSSKKGKKSKGKNKGKGNGKGKKRRSNRQ